MLQIMINYLYIFIGPFILGLVLRLIFFKFRKGFIVEILCAVLAAVLWGVAFLVPSYGSEANALLALQGTCLTVGALIAEGIIRLVRQ